MGRFRVYACLGTALVRFVNASDNTPVHSDNTPVHTTGEIILFGLRGRCPRCGVGKLFVRYLKITERCDACGLGIGGHDVGDGPVVPATLVLGGIIVGPGDGDGDGLPAAAMGPWDAVGAAGGRAVRLRACRS